MSQSHGLFGGRKHDAPRGRATSTAYKGEGKVVVDTEPVTGRIIIRGVHSLQPQPADEARATAGEVEMKWVLPDPCQPGTPVLVDVYFWHGPDAHQ